jgi:hypothetical protein
MIKHKVEREKRENKRAKEDALIILKLLYLHLELENEVE